MAPSGPRSAIGSWTGPLLWAFALTAESTPPETRTGFTPCLGIEPAPGMLFLNAPGESMFGIAVSGLPSIHRT